METNNKPDFESVSEYLKVTFSNPIHTKEDCYNHGRREIWNDYVIPLQSELESWKREHSDIVNDFGERLKERDAKISELQSILSSKTFFDEKDVLEKENQALKSELDKATKLLLVALPIVYRSGDDTEEHAAIKKFLGCKNDHGDDFEEHY